MDYVPVSLHDIADGVKFAIDCQKITSLPRPYLGMSQLGHPCSRNLWYYFRFTKELQHDARRERIFRRGSLEEPRVLKYLEGIGIKAVSTQEEHLAIDEHLQGHTDGVVVGVPDLPGKVLLEIKTMADQYFKQLTKNDLKTSKLEYYCQAQVYMFYSQCEHCLHITVNKNTEELYIEIVAFDRQEAEALVSRAIDIINAPRPLAKLSQDPKFYRCNWCEFSGPCHFSEAYHKTCRTCSHAIIAEKGFWRCMNDDTEFDLLTLAQQKQACPQYNVIKG